jgi:chaperonin GroES
MTKMKTKPSRNGHSAAVAEAGRFTHPLARCRPRGDRVVVRRDSVKNKTEGGILLPDSVLNERQQTGTVISVGPGPRGTDGKPVALDIKPGDRVVITGYAGLEIRGEFGSSENQEYVMLRDEDVTAILDEVEETYFA